MRLSEAVSRQARRQSRVSRARHCGVLLFEFQRVRADQHWSRKDCDSSTASEEDKLP
jgi:hypothetical protein